MTVLEDEAVGENHPRSVGIKVITGGQFRFPDDTQLISAMYWISSSENYLKEELTVTISHFAVIRSEEQCSKLRFIIADCAQRELPYTFREREGSFNPQHGIIKLEQSSIIIGAVGPKDTELYFSALKFYKPIPGTSKVEFVFVVVYQSPVYIQV